MKRWFFKLPVNSLVTNQDNDFCIDLLLLLSAGQGSKKSFNLTPSGFYSLSAAVCNVPVQICIFSRHIFNVHVHIKHNLKTVIIVIPMPYANQGKN